jgi:oligopeptidase B
LDKQQIPITPPKARQIPHEMEMHGDVRRDPYYWLKDRENEEVLSYLREENAYTDEVLQPVRQLRGELFEELKGRVKEKDASVPYLSNGYYYYLRYEEGHEYPIYCRKQGSVDAEEEVMLNVNDLAEGSEFFQVGGLSVSPDNRLLVYGEDNVGRRIYTLRILDLGTGEYLEDVIPQTTGSAAWANDCSTLFYTLRDEKTLRSFQVMRHRIGQPVSADEVVYEEKDDTFYTGIYRSRSEKYLFLYASSTLTSEYRFLSTDDPTGEFTLVQPRVREVEYEVEDAGDRFYIRTNADKCRNFKLVSCPVSDPAMHHWQDVIAHREDILLEDFICFRDHLVLQERIRGISELRILGGDDIVMGALTTDPRAGYYIETSEESHGVWFGANREYDTATLRFVYTSMTTPVSTYDINLNTGDRILLRERPVLGGFKKDDYDSRRIWVKVRDGVEVPVSMVFRKDRAPDGTNPLLLYGYGSYGNSMDPYFSSNRLSLLDRGFTFAIAHIRGGQEMGRHWYDDGKLLKKKNTFCDFIDCGEYLVENGFVSRDLLFAMGGSAGGLLMGAVVNMRPNLWKGVVAAVPFVDVVTTMLDDSIPLTTFEYDEWGDPADKAFYDYIKSYSPYDNVEPVEYPHMLVTTGLHDSQVQYWEPAKWVARLRELKKGDQLLLLKTNMDAGHGGASGRFKQFHEIALDYAFLLYLSGRVE